MNRIALASSLVIAFGSLAQNAALAAPPISWVSTGGPVGGLGYDVRIHPTNKQTMFVTDNYAGVIKSTDRGKSWRPANTGITVRGGPSADAYTIFSLTIDPNDPNVVWAGTNGDNGAFGVFKSIDGGASWGLKTNGITDGGFGIVFRGFTVQQGNSAVVYAQAELPTLVQGKEFNKTKGRVYQTTNGGDSWSLIWSGDDLARHLIIDPIDASVLYLSTGIFDREANNSNCAAGVASAGGVGVLKSTDGGGNWTPINSGLTDLYIGALRMHPSNHDVLFAATGNYACSGQGANLTAGLFRTSNGGVSWEKVIDADIFTTVGFSPSSPNVVYAASARAFQRSADGGTTWERFAKPSGDQWGSPGIRAGVPIDITVDPDDANILYANNYGGGVFTSTDGARTWEVSSRGYSGAEVHNLAVPDTRTTAIYAIGRSGPFVSSNYGLDWVGIGNGDAVFAEWYAVAVQPAGPDVVIISDEHQGFLLRSTNGGSGFVHVFQHPQADASNPARRQGFKAISFAPSAPSIVYAGVAKDRGTIDTSAPMGSVFYRSTDAGLGFTSPTSDLDGKNVHRLVVDRTSSNVLWAATSGGLYASVDSGTTWKLLGLGGQNVIAVAVNPTDPNSLVASVKNVGIFGSADGGTSWPGGPFNTGFTNPNPAVSALIFEPGGAALYAGDFYSGVYRSLDEGKSWAGFPDSEMTGLSMRAVKDLALAGSVLYAATQGGGVLRYGGPSIIPTPSATDFGTVSVGSSSVRTFALFNTGVASRALVGRTAGGANGAEFTVQNDTCAASLAPSASCTFDVNFAPTAEGTRTAVLNVASDDPFGAIYPIDLRGSAVEPVPDAGASADGAPADDGSPGGGGSGGSNGTGGASGTGGSRGAAGSTAAVDASNPGSTAGAPNPPAEGGCKCSLGVTSRLPIASYWVMVLLAFGVRRRLRESNRRREHRGWVLLACLSFARPVSAATLAVGPGKTYAEPCAAIAAATDGDTIEIDAIGNYDGDVCAIAKNGLTLRGIGGRARIDAAQKNYGGKAIWVISGNDTTVENIEFSGATVPDQNGAGIRQEGSNLTVRGCYFHDNEDGILTGSGANSQIVIEYSEFANNGFGDGFSHNMYIGNVGRFTLRYSYSHDSKIGHLVKSRAAENYILYNRVTGEAGTSSYEVDLPNAGTSYLIGNLIEQGPSTDNSTVVAYGEEGVTAGNPGHALFVINNTFVNDRTGGGTFVSMGGAITTPATIKNNVFSGAGTITNQAAAVLATNFSMGNAMLVNAATYDYHLLLGSPCVDAGSDPGVGEGFPLAPTSQYVHPSSQEGRIDIGVIDIGAYELGGGTDGGAGGSTAAGGSGGAGARDAGAAGGPVGSDASPVGAGGATGAAGVGSGDGAGCGCGFVGRSSARRAWFALLALSLCLRRRRTL